VDLYSDRERLAIEYAERFALDHTDMGELVSRMRTAYTDAEIVELAGTVAFCLGIGRVYASLEIANECPVVH
jgi:alkylhydroperoxidase family enzyme